ncbi:hypothetical protein [Pseudooceanicola atlanticus]|uniref:hypothetical protein n=1 Tax=Pseudooceanicola atlanticus TaxID=1461694 RepID=UPI0023564DAF|nr:hypothetical protein [Pseudooceanicola atlanticus]
MSKAKEMLPRREGETDSERVFREAVNRKAAELLNLVDGAINLRQTPSDVSRARAISKSRLEDFCVQARHTYDLAKHCKR